MSEVKDPTIKLFGKTILLVEDVSVIPTDAEISQLNSSATTKDPIQNNQKPLGGESTGAKEEEEVELINEDPRTPNIDKETMAEGLIGPATSSGISEDPKTSTADKETSSPEAANKEDPSDMSNPDEKTLKKPDKIVPCPRCNSMDTKFCYYNNYNVNQPRHFCKNCQRYWTAGGTMRNVPIGSGRRKNKNSPASNFRHIMVSEALQANGVHHSNSSILTLGSDSSPLCESMASALVLAEKSQNCARKVFQGNEQRILVSCGGREIGDDHLSGSSSTISIQTEKGLLNGQESVLKNIQGLPSQVPCFPVPPWSCTVPMPLPAFGPSGFPMSFYPPPPYWGCPVPNPWNMPWLSSQPSSPGRCAVDPSTPNSQTLGKHARDGSRLRPSNQEKEEVREMDSERSILIPKTLRINDPNEAAKSSIWSTLGIKNENTDSVSGGSLLKAFRLKGLDKNHTTDTSLVLQANPAALSRSLNFQETT